MAMPIFPGNKQQEGVWALSFLLLPLSLYQTLGEGERELKLITGKTEKSQKIPQKPTPALKKAFLRALRRSAPLKCLFKPTPRTPAEVVRMARFLLLYLDSDCGGGGIKHAEKVNDWIVALFGPMDFNFCFGRRFEKKPLCRNHKEDVFECSKNISA